MCPFSGDEKRPFLPLFLCEVLVLIVNVDSGRSQRRRESNNSVRNFIAGDSLFLNRIERKWKEEGRREQGGTRVKRVVFPPGWYSLSGPENVLSFAP